MADDILRDGKLLTLLAHLIVPEKREWGVAKLAEIGLFDDNVKKAITSALADKRYTQRNTGVRLSNVKVFIDEAVESHDYCFLNPRRTMEHLKRRIKLAAEHFSAERFNNSVILDYGCGTLNALSQSIIFIANGAQKVFAVEPATTRWEMTRRSALELVKAIFDAPEDFNFSGSTPEQIRSRVASIDFGAIKQAAKEKKSGKIDLGPIQKCDWLSDVPSETQFDLMVSTSVLEHVSALGDEAKLQASLLKHGGAAIHAVDFTDHRYDDVAYHPFKFYYDGSFKDCNGLRVGQMEGMFRDAGFKVSIFDQVKVDMSTIDMSRVSERFSSLSENDLTTRSATFVLASQ
ncbi:methyltransferase domain-containing protein [Sinorhizobium fredii]|uniref:methyltransferase domain-containing protein n=1 Tax=Rhizobium fredii TaxID=380 RepID=UPI003511839D